MNALPAHNKIFILILMLALMQFACLSAVAPSIPNPQQAPSGALQATQVPTGASAHGTPAEAKAMLQKAIEHYNAVGREQALADFNNRKVPFFDRDLYVACTNSSGIVTANGGFPSLVGSSANSVMTTDGKPLGKESWSLASTSAVNTVNYQWTDPVTGQTEPKTLFFQKVGTDVCGVGVYNP